METKMLELRPIDLKTARAFVGENHRHNKPPIGHKFSIACYDGKRMCGVVMVGRPVARNLDDGLTLEINRNCTDGTYNACTMLYGAACRAAKALGYKRIVTYTLQSEPGTSLKASGWTLDKNDAGGGYVERTFQTEGTDADHAHRRGYQIFYRKEGEVD